MREAAYKALGEKMIGQGDTVDQFEKKLTKLIKSRYLVSLNSGSSALELAYHLMDFKAGDEVISPVFTCTITNLALLRHGVKIVFADIKEDMMLDWDDVQRKITPKTKAVINVHLFNKLNATRDFGVPVIGDAAQFLGRTNGERFTAYSFQATKLITTVDGGALSCSLKGDYRRAKLLRWYGIDRETGKDNIDVDIKEAGFKYHMNNVTAAIGLAALPLLPKLKLKIKRLQNSYFEGLEGIPGVQPIGGTPFLIHTKNRDKLRLRLADMGIDSGLIHRRNDIYTVFGGKRQDLPNMNRLEKNYLLLPCHYKMSLENIEFICEAIKKSI